MKPFLQLVANDLYEKLHGDFSHTAVVFPNKRAGLFFNEHLAAIAQRPIWSPTYLTISELFCSLTDCKVGDSIELVCHLYRIFKNITQSKETLDEFYFWGELLISDFDDIDKNRVNADKLFSNLQELKAYDKLDFLSEEQEEAIRQFFQNFSLTQTTQLKQRFIKLWNVMGEIYRQFKATLHEKNIAYEGMLYRDVCETLNVDQLLYQHYIFVGFNVLNQVEHYLFSQLQKAGKARFYWDYDCAYLQTPNHEAGEFIRRNLQDFPSELPETDFNTFNSPKQIEYIAASTETAQAGFLSGWLRSHRKAKESETAIVLCNENLLQPVFHSLPDDTVKHVNITMGFPLAQTPAYSLVNNLLALQTEGYQAEHGQYVYAQVAAILKHPYICRLSPESKHLLTELTQYNRFYPLPAELQRDTLLTHLFTPCDTNLSLCRYLETTLQKVATIYQHTQDDQDPFAQLYRESLFKSYTLLNRFSLLLENGELNIRPITLSRLINKVLSATSIPFHGEPAIGLQIMGVLETRNLDFKNVAILSLNEGQLPKKGGEASFIPYNLRKAFGMTLIDHKNAVYAYYFYRLIQRSENVALLYNNASDGLNRGEMSRFMLQLLTESPHHIRKSSITAGQMPQTSDTIQIPKTQEVIRRLHQRFNATNKQLFSPSALNMYLDCQLKFYFHYIARLKPTDEVSSEIDSAMFGSIFHRSCQLLYDELTAHGKTIQREDIEKLIQNQTKLHNYVDTAFKELFFKVKPDEQPKYNGIQLINSEVIVAYLRQLLEKDKFYAPFTLIGTEQPVYEDFPIDTHCGRIVVRIGGIIDRIDSKSGVLRIVDYKTGGQPFVPANIESLFTPADKRPGYVFQTFLYAAILTRQQPLPVAPSLLYIHKAASPDYSPIILMGEAYKEKTAIDNFQLYDEEFRNRLKTLLEEIFSPTQAFCQTTNINHCDFCDFKELCRR